MAEYREGSILARIEELEVATNPKFRFENMREKIEYYKAVGELKAYKEIKTMVEARRESKEVQIRDWFIREAIEKELDKLLGISGLNHEKEAELDAKAREARKERGE